MKKSLLIISITFCLSLILSSCIPSSSKNGKRKKRGGSEEEISNDINEQVSPNFSNNLNYFQNGANISTTSLRLPINFKNTLYLRGEEVNFFIKEKSLNQTQCLAFYYPSSLDSKIIILKASAREFYNYSTNTREYYYLINPSEEVSNKNFCLKTGMINKMGQLYPGESIAFSFESLCPSCNTSISLKSSTSGLYTNAGNLINDVKIENLGIELQKGEVTIQTNLSCTTAQECTNIGLDCCSFNVCIKDKTIKSTTDQTSTGFLQALAHIRTSSKTVYDYAHYYNLCTEAVVTDNDEQDENALTSAQLAKARIDRLEELYNCTTPQIGEMSICTDNHINASLDVDQIFTVNASDKNFATIYQGSSLLDFKSIQEVKYGTVTLYDKNHNSNLVLSGDNDDLTASMSVTLTAQAPLDSNEDILKIKYKVDGSCERVSAGLAICNKYYTQGSNLAQTIDHYPSIQKFNLPQYADTAKLIKVEVDDDFKVVNSDWNLVISNPSYVEFENDSKVYDTQIVKITYFVDLLLNPNIMTKFEEALAEVSLLCECPDHKCRLAPIFAQTANENTIVDYKCSYPGPQLPDPPLQTQFALSSKTIPVRYFDIDGGLHDNPDAQTPKQEGEVFEYTNNDLLKPSNTITRVGFNEIYGNINGSVGSAKAPKMIRVTKNKSYNIFVDSGSYSSCLNCGNDYYSNITKLFPGTFLQKGGGFLPDPSQTDPFTSTKFRSDDQLFGRACFVPVTMLPHTHEAKSTRKIQRRDRMEAQHFLFANGMNRDWYGFDYGAIIGSFDGVTWFAIGNNRRITAKTNKLYIAVNAYFGDLATENSFTVTVSESSSVAFSGSAINTDFENDGAQCQQYHVCEKDSDCASTLGWDYMCVNVGNIKTNWPKFDSNGLEIPGAQVVSQLIKIIGPQIAGGTNRCVYRGKGAACDINYTTQTIDTSYNFATKEKLLACSSNNYCQTLPAGGTGTTFNNKIARYAKSIKNQNQSSSVTENNHDLFGLGARIIGRPFDYNGTEIIPINIHTNLSYNKIRALCLPGRQVQNSAISTIPAVIPNSKYNGDKVNNNGMTLEGTAASPFYYSSCSTFDPTGNYINFSNSLLGLLASDPLVTNLAGAQSLSTNGLTQIETLHATKLVKDFDNEFIEEVSLEKNRCLRAPGASCFTNLDCAPSSTISNQILGMDPDGFLAQINRFEIKFWQEDLICSSEVKKDSEDYNLKDNRCCRETGKTISIATDSDLVSPIVNTNLLPGVEISLTERTRYSRNATSHYERKSDPVTYPIMRVSAKDVCAGAGANCFDPSFLEKQFNTLNITAGKTCCSKNWVREFDSSNGGGHIWSPLKMQKIDKSGFTCLNFTPFISGGAGVTPTCEGKDPLNPSECPARSISEFEALKTLNWVQKFELLGIPQITIESEQYSNTHCSIDPANSANSGAGIKIKGFLKDLVTEADSEYATAAASTYASAGAQSFSATDLTNFSDNFERIFSSDEFSCCLPLGNKVSSAADANLCCSGNINPDNLQCALKNYTNLSTYFNKYVSSEAQNLPENNFDSKTGFIKSTATVEQLACEVEACSSGLIARGVAWTELKITGLPDSEVTVNRFLDGDGVENNYQGKASLFNAGLRWNNNVYCVPQELSQSASGLNIRDCNPGSN